MLIVVSNLRKAKLFGSEILRSQMYYLWSEIWGRRDYLVSDVSSISLPSHFLSVKWLFEIGHLFIIWSV